MQKEIKNLTPLLDDKGRISNPGYAKTMQFQYDRKMIKASPFSLKEWDFYQLVLGDYICQITIGHISYIASFSATLFSVKTGEVKRFTRLKPFPLRSLQMPQNPEELNQIEIQGKDYKILFETKSNQRTLKVKAQDLALGKVEIDVVLDAPSTNEKMVIATPLIKKNQFYLNYKENYYGVQGKIRFGDTILQANCQDTAVLDWGRGVWPFKQEWFWGNGAAFTNVGKFGFNIGWGFGDLSHATENMFFWNGKAHKLGHLYVERNENDYMAPWKFKDKTGKFDFVMTPVYDNFTSTKIAFVHTQCHQVFGKYNGNTVLPNGEKLEIRDMLAFCEHAINRW